MRGQERRLLRSGGEALIPDTHIVPTGWGIRPILFVWGGLVVPSYSTFATLGLVAAVLLYYLNTRNRGIGNNGLYIALAAAIGGIIGAKVPAWLVNLPQIIAHPGRWDLVLSGRTIVGGLIGGVVAVYLTKRRLGIKVRLGNYLVPSLCIGIFFGRIGCFLAGCCYGQPTSLPWGVNFGDGIPRHPTQLYEALFVLGLLIVSQTMKDRFEPGQLFRWFMVTYFSWRFLIEFIRVNPVAGFGLTYYQLASLAIVVSYLLRNVIRSWVPQGEGAR
jgi:phosphatidylglycerol:prolipoprotein diacylglycerol transferase